MFHAIAPGLTVTSATSLIAFYNQGAVPIAIREVRVINAQPGSSPTVGVQEILLRRNVQGNAVWTMTGGTVVTPYADDPQITTPAGITIKSNTALAGGGSGAQQITLRDLQRATGQVIGGAAGMENRYAMPAFADILDDKRPGRRPFMLQPNDLLDVLPTGTIVATIWTLEIDFEFT